MDCSMKRWDDHTRTIGEYRAADDDDGARIHRLLLGWRMMDLFIQRFVDCWRKKMIVKQTLMKLFDHVERQYHVWEFFYLI